MPRVPSGSHVILGFLIFTFPPGIPAFAGGGVIAPYRDPVSQVIPSLGGARLPADPRDPMHLPDSHASLLIGASGDELWSDEFGLPIANGVVVCAAMFQGSLIVGGGFTAIGGRPMSYIAGWNGTEWVSVGGGIDGPVFTLLVDGDRLLAGGYFRFAGGRPARAVAVWDGLAWSPIGPSSIVGDEDYCLIRAMTRYQGDLIVGGSFQSSLDPAIQGIARFDGTDWRADLAHWQRVAGFENVYNFHTLRHTANTNVYRATKDLFLTQRFARHANPITTVAYTHASDEELYEAIGGL